MDDKETQNIVAEQKSIESLTQHEAWPIIRGKLTDKILDLQNAFNIDDRTATTMLRDLSARKLASTMLFDWLREIEGTAEQAKANESLLKKKSHIIRFDE